ncbi:MAG: 50S ribosomal protein L19e [Candidatus Woesearchaeota archaeon]
MKLDTQKRLAASVLKCSEKRIRFDEEALESISEAITKEDIRDLIRQKSITKLPVVGQSRVRANKRLVQKRKGRQKGPGSLKGKRTARLPRKEAWMTKIRAQRKHLQELRDEETITKQTFRNLYGKAKGGFFRSKRHITLYIQEQSLEEKR